MATENIKFLTVLTTGAANSKIRADLMFGAPVWSGRSDEGGHSFAFRPGQVFGYHIRNAGDPGSDPSRVFVVMAGRPGETFSAVPAIRPGAHILMSAAGKVHTMRAVRVLRNLMQQHDPLSISAEKWRVLGSRIVTEIPVDLEEFFV